VKGQSLVLEALVSQTRRIERSVERRKHYTHQKLIAKGLNTLLQKKNEIEKWNVHILLWQNFIRTSHFKFKATQAVRAEPRHSSFLSRPKQTSMLLRVAIASTQVNVWSRKDPWRMNSANGPKTRVYILKFVTIFSNKRDQFKCCATPNHVISILHNSAHFVISWSSWQGLCLDPWQVCVLAHDEFMTWLVTNF